MLWCNFGRRTFLHLNNPLRSRCFCTTTTTEVKKLTIRNVFKDNPSAKYYLLTAITVTAGVTYYVYNNQQKKKLILNLLPARANHYIVSQSDEIDILNTLLQGQRHKLKQVQISGLPGSGKTQLARLVVESLNQSRKDSFQFKVWPQDEVTVTVVAHSKEALLSSYKQLASKLGCERDEIKMESQDFEQQLDVFSRAVREKLKKRSSWIMVVDDHDPSQQLTKWLPDFDWGNGYAIYTVNSEKVHISQNKNQYTKFSLNQMRTEGTRLLFSNVVNNVTADLDRGPQEHLLSLLQYNPLSVVCAAVYYKYKIKEDKNYSYDNLYTDIEQTVKWLQEVNPSSNKLQITQTSSATLAAKVLGECSPELLHVFDFLGSSNVDNVVPVSVFSHHLKTTEYHVRMKMEETPEEIVSSEEASLSVNATSFEHEHNLWSFRGIVDRAVQAYERIKLEVNAIKSLFGYGDAAFAAQSKTTSDGLEVIRSCPLFIISHEPMADIEVVTIHPILHDVLRQVFTNVTIPLLEKQHLVLAERKHQHKSYFGRLQRFDPQSTIAEYRKGLGDCESLNVDEGYDQGRNHTLGETQPCVDSILRNGGDRESASQAKSENTIGHLQEHLIRVVNSLSNHYRIAGGDSNVMVARAMLQPHLEAVLQENSLTAASKAQAYRTLASIQSDVYGDNRTAKQYLNKAHVVCMERYGEDSLEVAGVLTEQAELCSTSAELDQSKVLLERAVEIYRKNIKTSQTNKQPFQYGNALVALGITCGSLGETDRSKDLLEKGLMELQNAAPDDPRAKENKWFAAEISSAVTNLGHAYLSLGKINQGRKLLELALIGHQNVHGDVHGEVIRTLTTLSIAHAMQGNSQESKRLRNEAGKIKKKLDMKTPLFLH